MVVPIDAAPLEEQIDQWRAFLRRRQAIHAVDIAELEDHLREQIRMLGDSGLAPDEAFLVAVKRLGDLDTLSREFAHEHSERLWKQLVVAPADSGEREAAAQSDALAAFAFAAAAALAIKLPALFGIPLANENDAFYLSNASLFVLPFLTGYFAWKRRLDTTTIAWLGAAFVIAAVFANAYPFGAGIQHIEVLSALHLPIALWLAVGVAYAGGRWRETGGRMDFIRFTGELFIYYVLIALGGGVFLGFMMMIFAAIGIDAERFLESWLPSAAIGAVVVAAWLVEAKQSVIENMAPVLTRLFTPLFAILLVTFLATLLITGRGIDIEREILIAFDLLLVVVLGLLVYAVSARDPWALPGMFDYAQVVLVISALLVDAVALWAISARITEFGFSPNRVAALGMNLVLLVNLAWSAVLYIRFLRGDALFTAIERWQTAYLPVYAVWAAAVVVVFPPLFGYT